MMLVSQRDLKNPTYPGPEWYRIVLRQLDERLGVRQDFPCTFSQNAFRRELIKFVFVDALTPAALDRAAEGLNDYVRLSREWDGLLSTAHPLIVAFSTAAVRETTVEAYHRSAWRVLQHWHGIDPEPWPADVATDPHSPYWTMCFAGMQIFVNISNPAHRNRRSRNLGEHLIFVVNPRERFDIVAGDTPEGVKVRQRIRSRIGEYDAVGHCSQLGLYQAGDTEWWQYGIIEENRERTDRCPFEFRPKQTRELVTS